MNALEILQREFQARLLRGQESIVAGLVRTTAGDASARLRIYEYAYEERLVDALRRAYPALRAGLGAERFDELARAFVRETPSSSRSIRDYGGDLSAFVVQLDLGASTRALSELAAWEWLLMDVFDAAGAEPLTVDALAGVPPENWGRLRFATHPTLRRFRSSTNAVELWRRWSTDSDRALTVTDDTAPGQAATRPVVPHETRPTEWVLWRRELTTHYRSVESAEARALDALLAGASFADICEVVAQTEPEELAALRSAQLLRGWVESGLIAGT